MNREDLPEGLIIIEDSGEKNSVHLTRALNQRYLPSTAKTLNTKKLPVVSEEAIIETAIDEVDVETGDVGDQLNHEFATLPGTQFSLRLSSNGEFEQVDSETDSQVIEDLAIEAKSVNHMETAGLKKETVN